MQLKVNKDEECKVKALKDNIVKECRKRGFTLDEFEQLANVLFYEAKNRREEIYQSVKF